MSQPAKIVTSGLPALDRVLQGLRLGDNVVWQVNRLDHYRYFAEPFARQALKDGRRCVYLRFAPHAPILPPLEGLATIAVDPHLGFDAFSGALHQIIEDEGREVFYVFDSLSSLVVEWATDELLANFFQVTCPYLFELDTVAFFALTRGRHSHSAVARIRDTTQLLLDVYQGDGSLYLHPLKVWDRYSPQMFLPHEMSGEEWTPVFGSGEAAAVAATASRKPLSFRSRSTAPWDSVYRRLMQYHEAGVDLDEQTPEVAALKQELSRMMIGTHPEFNRLVDTYMTLDDLFAIRDRLIGSGRIGGKAAGMLIARRILVSEPGDVDFKEVLEPHDSFYIGSDVFFTFLVNNDLFRLRLQLSRATHISHDEFAEVEKRFLTGRFPPEIMEQFRDMLAYFGQAPIIARSSSLLEDSFGNAFAGKYHSEYCANQGTPDERLEAFLRAVKLVYASALNPDAMTYRRARGLGESDEQMAILVQRVSGTPYKHYFFPSLAGVAFSRNLYAWTDRIDPAQGMIRLVFGLGTRAVNRVGNDYPRMIAVSHPQLRPESGVRIAKYSQWEVDLIDLAGNVLTTVPVDELLQERDYPNLALFVSLMKDGYPADPWTSRLEATTEPLVFTFNQLLARTPFVHKIGSMLTRLEKAYGQPLDTEFTASVDGAGRVRINLLQCRPMRLPGATGPIQLPKDVPAGRVLFRSSRTISGGLTEPIRYLLYIDPARYGAIETPELKKALGRIVGRINEHPLVAAGRVLMMGPGRWGSSNIELGVNVTYADINNTAVLVEMAREEAGQVPEVSYGTHFFLDLVEAQIIYLPVYPNDPEAEFNRALLEGLPNILTELLPDAERFSPIIRVFDLPTATGGRFARVAADPQSQRAICYLE
ncbi:MAG: PEP/pyruvate-binding domain-containing protein [Deltaproteobacteria bacterium]|nr:PEP/pyruvate-binding domain-containing protein [Deltaproteobacteria bacterium]